MLSLLVFKINRERCSQHKYINIFLDPKALSHIGSQIPSVIGSALESPPSPLQNKYIRMLLKDICQSLKGCHDLVHLLLERQHERRTEEGSSMDLYYRYHFSIRRVGLKKNGTPQSRGPAWTVPKPKPPS